MKPVRGVLSALVIRPMDLCDVQLNRCGSLHCQLDQTLESPGRHTYKGGSTPAVNMADTIPGVLGSQTELKRRRGKPDEYRPSLLSAP